MADENSQSEITKRLAELPEDVRALILSPESGARIRAIGQRHNLHVDQLGSLENETMFVMLGFFEPENFSAQLQQQLLIPAEEASTIAKEVSDEIFMPIRESLKKFSEAKKVVAPVPAASVPTPAPAETPVKINTVPNPVTPTMSAPSAVPNIISAPIVTPPMQAPTPIVAPVSVTPVVSIVPPTPPATPTPSTVPTSPIAPSTMPQAEQALTEKTVVKPSYKTDPYREPIE